jgi:GNAT superfamily N-acetyltransferase
MADELARAVSFMAGMQDRMAKRKVASRFGTALFNDELARVFYLNALRVEGGPPMLRPAELVQEVDALQAQLEHRKLEVNDERGRLLEQPFRDLGWKVERDAVMVYRRGGRDGDASKAVEVTSDDLRGTWEQGIRQAPHGHDEDVVRQLVAAQLGRERAVDIRYFSARADGRLVSECSLYSHGGMAQVESVQTLEAYRGRGFASATITKAVQEAEAAGHDLVFLLADDQDWPKALYAKLGFETVGYVWEFLRAPQPSMHTDPT